MGAEKVIDGVYFETSLEFIQTIKPSLLLSLEQTTQSLDIKDYQFVNQKRAWLVVGNEVNGVDKLLLGASDDRLEIALFCQATRSFNVAAATAIALSHFVFFSKN